MSLEQDILTLRGEVESLRSRIDSNEQEEQSFREFMDLVQMRRDIKELRGLISGDIELDNLDKPDPLEPIYDEGDTVGFTGVAYVAGRRQTGLDSDSTKPWVKCDVSTGIASEQTGPPSSPFDPNEEWFEKDNTYGNIHVPRL